LRRQSQCAHDTADSECGVDVAEPQDQFLLLFARQRRLEIGDQGARGLVAGDDRIAGGSDDAAQVAEIELVELALCGFGSVAPFGGAELRQQILCHLHHGRLGHGGATFLGCSLILLAQALAHGTHALQRQFGNRALLRRELLEHCVAMGLPGTQAFRLRAFRDFGRRREVRPATRTTAVLLACTITTTIATTIATAFATAALAIPTFRTWPATAVAVAARTPISVAARTPISVTSSALAALTLGAGLDDGLEVTLCGEQFDDVTAIGLGAVVHGAEHRDAIDLLFDFDLQLVADLAACGQDRAIEHTLGLLRSSSTPGPRAVAERAGEFDVDPSRHGQNGTASDSSNTIENGLGHCEHRPMVRADGGAGYVRHMPIYALGDQVPDIHPSAYVHPDAVIIGTVTIGADSSVWPGAVLRGDEGEIRIGAQTSIQDNSVLHTTVESPTIVGDRCVIGHIVHLEGCTVHDDVLIGNASVVLHDVQVHSGSIVAANSVLLNGTIVPPGAIAVGSPAQIKEGRARRELIEMGVREYVTRARRFSAELRRID
jgi:carbonic anhydrase/acetyltransferase-like protein (isoleucine patch superfamily)